jgi:hypothetical protein
MKTLQEIYGSNFWKEIGKGILGRQKDEMRRKILKQVEEVKARGYGVIKRKQSDQHKWERTKKMCFDFDFGVL